MTEINPALPSLLGRILRRCLVKDAEHRYQTAKDLRNELQELKREVDSGELQQGVASRKSATVPKWMLAAMALLALGVALYLLRRSPEKTSHLTPTFTQLTSIAGVEAFPSLSPDGDSIVYVSAASGNQDIYLQRVGGQNAINLTEDSPVDDTQPAFSPDGTRIAFRSERDGGGLFVMGATGESVKRVSDNGFNSAWSPDGELLVFSSVAIGNPNRGGANVGELRVVRFDTGEVHAIDLKGDAVQPSWSPHGHRIAFWSHSLSERNYRDIWTVPAEEGEVVAVTRDEHVDWNPVWSPDGKYLYFCSSRGGAMSLWRVAVEEATGAVLEAPELVTSSPAARMGQTTIARDGRHIAYQADISTQNIYRVSFDPDSEAVVGGPIAITSGSRWATYPNLSPDGQWVAFTFFFGGGQADIAVIRTDGTGLRQLTDEPHFASWMPRWSPDGSELVFYSGRSGNFQLWSIHPDGSGLRQLTETPNRTIGPVWSPDGKRIVYFSWDGDSYIFQPDVRWKEQSPEKLPRLPEGRFMANSWSPDGERLAGDVEYESGKVQIAVFSLVSREYRVFPVAGAEPVWLNDNRRLLFSDGGKIFLLDGKTGGFHEVLSLERDMILDRVDLSSDDSTIYFRRVRSEADIWMVTLDEEPR